MRTLGKAVNLCQADSVAAWSRLTTAIVNQSSAPFSDLSAQPATGEPCHPFQPVITKASTGDLYVPKGAKIAGQGAHPLARYRFCCMLLGSIPLQQSSVLTASLLLPKPYCIASLLVQFSASAPHCGFGRSFFPKAMWNQIDNLFPRGSQPVAYDVAIGTGRGAIELAKRQGRQPATVFCSNNTA